MAWELAALFCAISTLALYHGLFVLIVITLPNNATAARAMSALLISVAAYFVRICAIELIRPLLLQSTLLTCFLVHWLSLIDYICMAKLDSAKLSELVTQHKHNTDTDRGNHVGGQTGDKAVSASTASIGQQVWKALALTTNFRRLGTEWEVKNIYYSDTKPTPLDFVIDVLPKTALSYLLIDAVMHAPAPEAHLVTEAKQTWWKLWTLNGKDLAFRVPAVISFWVTARLVIYVLTQGVLGLPSVILGLSSPDHWPSAFGSLRELYTIRGFWG
ncbi:hypothetical protein PWT90_00355 [Aphanocladium album]|nr:hypothetical protein PWT90_00355 [Aphanocladium album]